MKKSELKQIIKETILTELQPILDNPIYECQPWALDELSADEGGDYETWIYDYGEDTADALVLLDAVIKGTKKRFTKKDVENAFKRIPTREYDSLKDMWAVDEDNLNNKVNSLIEFFKNHDVIK